MTDEKKERKLVFLVVMACDYEGYDRPEAAFFSEEKADAMASKLNRSMRSRSCRYEVLEVEIEDGL